MDATKNTHNIDYSFCLKEVFTFKEACIYTGLSKSKLYKHTSAFKIPFFKPEGKKIYFKKSDLEKWLLRNEQLTSEEIELKAGSILLKGGTKC